MNALTVSPTDTNTGPVMSSLRIAELTGKRHDHVLRDIRKMLTDIHGEGGVPSFEDTRINPQNNQAYPCFLLDEVHTLTLLTGYDAKARFAVNSEWLVMKQQPVAIDLNDPPSLRAALLGYTEKVIELQGVVAEQAPKVAALERLEKTEGSVTPRDVGKIIKGLTQTKTIDLLLECGLCYRDPPTGDKIGRLRAYATAVKRGLLEEKLVDAGFTRDGVEQVKPQVLITPLGCSYLAKRFVQPDVEPTLPTPEPDLEVPPPNTTLRGLRSMCVACAQVHGQPKVIETIKQYSSDGTLAGIPAGKWATFEGAITNLLRTPKKEPDPF